jgi:hypothetical protein
MLSDAQRIPRKLAKGHKEADGITVLAASGASMSKPGPLPEITLLALDEALMSLGKANASDTLERVRAHIGQAVAAIDTALQYAEAVAHEVAERSKPLN